MRAAPTTERRRGEATVAPSRRATRDAAILGARPRREAPRRENAAKNRGLRRGVASDAVGK